MFLNLNTQADFLYTQEPLEFLLMPHIPSFFFGYESKTHTTHIHIFFKVMFKNDCMWDRGEYQYTTDGKNYKFS